MPILKYDGSAAAETLAPTADLFGTTGVDTLSGTAAAESFWGGEGDRMVGGPGDDTYWLKHARDQVVETAGGGIDKVAAWANINLADHPAVENLLVGGEHTYGAGNSLDNIVEGQGGSQQLYGGAGQDVLIGGAGADTFVVVRGEGNDSIQDFAVGEDVIRLKAGFSSFAEVKAAMTQVGADVQIAFGGFDGLMVRNTTVDGFTAANFQLEMNPGSHGALTFGDDFSGPLSLWDAESNPTGTWRPDFGYQGSQGAGSYSLISNDEKQVYTSPWFRDHAGDFSESPFVSNPDGTLSIWARPSANPEIFGSDYTSGFISTKESHSQTYGYFEMRADIPDAAGAWPAFWMIPTDGSWPPELDIMETLTSDPNAAWTTQHSSTGGHSSEGKLAFIPDTADGFHTYGALWTPSELTWYVDNVEVFRSPTPADMHKPMFMIANLALGGWGGAIDAAALPAEFKIDYIRAYGLPDGGEAVTSPAAGPAPAPTPAANPVPAPAPTPAPTPATASGQDLNGTAGADTLMGGAADERLNGGDGEDYMRGGDGADVMSGGEAFDDMNGNTGADTLSGDGGGDWVVGGKDNDFLLGAEGDDIVYGNLGQDLCDGGAGNDLLRGGQDDDQVFGWSGADWISGDRGNDTLSGGSGADTFHTFGDAGLDRVTDFSLAEGDRVQLDPGTQFTVSQAGADTVISMTGGGEMILVGVSASTLTGDWIFGA